MPTATVVFALLGGSFIVLAVAVVLFFAVVYGFFTIRGSGIGKHPNDGRDGAPGSEGPSEASGTGRTPGTPGDETHGPGDAFSEHGTR